MRRKFLSGNVNWATAVAVTMLGSVIIYVHSTRLLFHSFRHLPARPKSLSLWSATPTKKTARRALYVYLPMAGGDAHNNLNATRRQWERFVLAAWNSLLEQQEAIAMALSVCVVALMEDAEMCPHSTTRSSDFLESLVCLSMPSECRHPHYNIPTMGCVFHTIRAHAPQGALVMYANGDLLFGLDLFEAIISLAQGSIYDGSHPDFVMVGTRREIEVPGRPIGHDRGTSITEQVRSLRRHARQDGVTFSKYGIDYFVFSSRDVVPVNFPEFLLGRWRWDNALMAHYLLNDIPTVDASTTVLAVHLGSTPDNNRELYTSRKGWDYNDALVRACYGEYFYLGHTENAWFAQSKNGVLYTLHERNRKALDTAIAAIDHAPYVAKSPRASEQKRDQPHAIEAEATQANSSPIDETLHVLLAVTNPCNDPRRHLLMKEALLRLEKVSHVLVYVVEVAFEADQPFRITSSKNSRHLWLHKEQVSAPRLPMWYKENLLNLGVEQLLPRDWKTVAWIDGDVEWDSPLWARDALQLLASTKDVLQLFSHAVFMNDKGDTDRIFTGYAYNFERKRSYEGYGNDLWHPGFGWAYSRAAYDQMGGFFELELSGLGDGIMAHCIKGGFDWASYSMGFSSDGHYQAIVQYNVNCEGLRMGYVPGVLRHYFHGTYEDRRYAERRQLFDRHSFDPLTALRRDPGSGLLSPTDNFPEGLKELLTTNACAN